MRLKSPSLLQLQALLSEESSLLMEGLWDAPKAAILRIALNSLGKSVLVISSDTHLIDDLPFFGVKEVLEFPSWETLPGEEISPSPDIVGRRLQVLYTLASQNRPSVILTPVQGALQKVVSKKVLLDQCRHYCRGEALSFSSLPQTLQQLGYRRASVVVDKGEYAIRGGIIDLFPISFTEPCRLDFFGDVLEDIRLFDPISQKSTGKTDAIFLSPAHEIPGENLITDYLETDSWVIFDDLLSLEDKAVSLQKLPGAQSKAFLSFSELITLPKIRRLFWTKEAVEELSEVTLEKRVGRSFYTGASPLQPLAFEMGHEKIQTKRWRHPFLDVQGILPNLKQTGGVRFICGTETEERSIRDLVEIPKDALFERGHLSSGFALVDGQEILIPTAEITHKRSVRRQKWRSTTHTPASEFHELAPGDLVVHFHNGIGKYLGIERKKNHLGEETEFMVIAYAEESKLFVPIAQSYLVSRYIGAHEEVPTLHTLGTKNWQNTKQKAQKAIIGYAQDLLKITAEREVKGGFVYPPDSTEMELFEHDFPYVETEDQKSAISLVKAEMMSSKAMDRLICGDVGYGKTEVAIRAAFKAVMDGKKQVAVLVPTTVLALQHFETFSERMLGYPIVVRALSRFQSKREINQTIKQTAEGKVDILIGTHRLIGKDVVFKDLGLIIIDEEQRFGVRAKEHLKKLKAGVDCLTLTATPIPRTLYLSLIGAREISLINTPPQDRLPIKTIIAEKDPTLIQNALLRELSRDGQAFFIHNRVESIFLVTEELQKLVPQARIVTAHGQMDSDAIDTAFHAFKQGHADILVATTIIESGIDIPNANTMIIDRADQFGLADLYQLRGRVGRWNRPAYTYFLTPKGKTVPEIARKRLFALLEAQGYGGGMKIAMRDLEIRGAGDILGTQQSGQISAIGFHLYCKLLKRTVEALKKQTDPTFFETKIEFPFEAKLPEDYIPETALRLELYHRLGEMVSKADAEALFQELQDRFGTPPLPVLWLLSLTRIRILAAEKRYLLLKYTKHSLYTEQQKKHDVIKKTVSLPSFKTPEQLESLTQSLL